MPNGFLSIAGEMLGLFLVAVVLSLLFLPFLIGLLMAFNVLRYRDWLAGIAIAASFLALANNGDLLYNLTYMPMKRFFMVLMVPIIFSFVAPPFLLILSMIRSRRWWWPLLLTLFLAPMAIFSMRREFLVRRDRDVVAYREGVKILSPSTGTDFVPWSRDFHQAPLGRLFLQGHISESTKVVLLTDPFTVHFQPEFCTAIASTYLPPAKDPADLGNVTELADTEGCNKIWQSGVAALERQVASYKELLSEPVPAIRDSQARSNPVVRKAFEKLNYDLAKLDWSKPQVNRIVGPGQRLFFITMLPTIQPARSAFPCSQRALLLSAGTPENIRAVLPVCSNTWHAFQLNDELYLAVVTEQPIPPEADPHGPEWTHWLFRVEAKDVKQLWPPL
jgi:hypothetical protein